jgi:hypothetical protein
MYSIFMCAHVQSRVRRRKTNAEILKSEKHARAPVRRLHTPHLLVEGSLCEKPPLPKGTCRTRRLAWKRNHSLGLKNSSSEEREAACESRQLHRTGFSKKDTAKCGWSRYNQMQNVYIGMKGSRRASGRL